MRTWLADENLNENMVAISFRLNTLEEVPIELVFLRVHTVTIECNDWSYELADNVFIGGKGIQDVRAGWNVVYPLITFKFKLWALILYDCVFEEISFLKGLKSNLEMLVIDGSEIEALPPGL